MNGLDWLWWTSGGVTGVAGLLLLYWSLFHDRARGRRRCPRCWYDMAGISGFTCPECGSEAKTEKRLHRTHRRWCAGAAAVILLMLGTAAGLTPRVQDSGFLSLVPTELLMFFGPDAGREYVSGPPYIHPFTTEIAARLTSKPLSDHTWQIAMDRKGVLITPARWPQDRPLIVAMREPRWAGLRLVECTPRSKDAKTAHVGSIRPYGCAMGHDLIRDEQAHQNVGLLDNAAQTVVFDVRVLEPDPNIPWWESPPSRTVWSGTTTRAIELVSCAEDALDAVHDPHLDQAIQDSLEAKFIRADGELLFTINLQQQAGINFADLALGFRAELWHEGKLRETRKSVADSDEPPYLPERRACAFTVASLYGACSNLAADTSLLNDWRFRLIGDAEISLGEPGCTRYWAGEITVPLADIIDLSPLR